MNRLKIYTTRLQTKNIPLKTQTLLESKNNAKDSSSGYGRHKLNIVTQDIIDEYLNKMDLDMSNDNDNEVIIKLLKKPTKTKNDIEIIMKVFNKISFFQDLQKKIPISQVRQLIKEFKYDSKKIGDVIFQCDEIGIDYYILLKGSLFLLLPKSNLNVDYTSEKQYVASQYLTEPPLIPISNVLSSKSFMEIHSVAEITDFSGTPKLKTDAQANNQNNNTPKNLFSANRNSHISPSQKKRFSKASEIFFKRKTIISENLLKENEKSLIMDIKNAFPDFEIVKKLEAVTGFGEIALMSNLKRTATIVCRENCHLVTLSKPNYEKILKEHHENIVQSKINFIKGYSFFSEWNTSKMLSLWELLKLNTFPKNFLVFKEGDESKSFYFIKEGEIEISKVFDLNDEVKHLSLSSYNSKEYQRNCLNDLNLVWADSQWRKKVKRVKLALLGPGSYFGEEEVLLTIPRNTRAIVVSSSAEIFKCPSEKFFAYVKTIHNLQILKEDIRIKNEWRETYIRSIKQINKILKNATSPNFLQSPRFAKTESLKFPIQIIDATSSSLNRSYKKRRVATPNEKPIDLNNLTVLENLHHQMKSMLKLKKALNFKTHQDQCKENSKFLNSLMEDQNKKFYIISLQTPSGVKLIGATKDIFLKRRKSANLRIEPKIKQKKRNSLSINHKKEENEDNQYKVAIQSKIENIKENSQSFKKTYIRARSLSINNINISFGDKIKNQISYTTKHPEFQNGRRLKKKFYKPLKKKN